MLNCSSVNLLSSRSFIPWGIRLHRVALLDCQYIPLTYHTFGKLVSHLPPVTRTRNRRHTLPETNIAPENRPSQKETSIPTIHFQVRAVSFREGSHQKIHTRGRFFSSCFFFGKAFFQAHLGDPLSWQRMGVSLDVPLEVRIKGWDQWVTSDISR